MPRPVGRIVGPVGLARVGDFFIQPARLTAASLGFFVRSRPATTWATGASKVVGNRVIATSTTAFLGIHFECTTPGTTDGSTEPTWNTAIGGATAEATGTVSWITRGSAAAWQANKNYAVGDRVIKVTRTPGSYTLATSAIWDCTVAGASHATTEPTWPTTITADVTVKTDNTVTWTARKASTWDNAHPFMDAMLFDTTNATMAVVAGNRIYVSKNHNETSVADITITLPGTGTSPNEVLCVNDDADPAAPSALATTGVLVGGTSNNTITVAGGAYIYGLTFTAASGAGVPAMQVKGSLYFDACVLKHGGTGAGAGLILESSLVNTADELVLNNTVFNFAAASQYIQPRSGRILWKNTANAIAGTAPTILFVTNSSMATSLMEIKGVDLSALGSSNSLISVAPKCGGAKFLLEGCKLGAGVSISTGTHAGIGGRTIELVNCDSADTNYRSYRETYGGTLVHETSVVRTGGATDNTQQLSWKMASNVNAAFKFPLESFPIIAWNDTASGNVTATVEFVHDGVPLNTDGIWAELEYMGTAGLPLTLFSNNAKANILANGVAQPTSTATWAGTGGFTNVIKQNLAITFSPVKKGPVTIRVYLAKTNKIIYLDPIITFS